MALMVLAKKKDWNGKGFLCTEVLVGYIKEKSFFLFCFVFSHYIKENTVSDLSYSRYIIIEVKARY